MCTHTTPHAPLKRGTEPGSTRPSKRIFAPRHENVPQPTVHMLLCLKKQSSSSHLGHHGCGRGFPFCQQPVPGGPLRGWSRVLLCPPLQPGKLVAHTAWTKGSSCPAVPYLPYPLLPSSIYLSPLGLTRKALETGLMPGLLGWHPIPENRCEQTEMAPASTLCFWGALLCEGRGE